MIANNTDAKTAGVAIPELVLPKAGGALRGLDGVTPHADMSGMAQLTLPLPISPARQLTPVLSLNYQSSGGNGPFGLGWALSVAAIRRRTNKGTPSYSAEDTFIGSSGEILVPDPGNPTIQTIHAQRFQTTRFYCHRESRFDCIEYWESVSLATCKHWLVKTAEGTQHLFGYTEQARLYDPRDPRKILSWLLEESLDVYGEHCVYHYKSENEQGVDLDQSSEKTRQHTSQRYLKKVCYANEASYPDHFYALDSATAARHLSADISWLFELVLDYGEHSADGDAALPEERGLHYQEKNPWVKRLDSFSDYAGGFEIRTHRLCRRVLMFHRFAALGTEPCLVKGLRLNYQQTPVVSLLHSARLSGYPIVPHTDPAQKQTILSVPPVEWGYQCFALQEKLYQQDWQPWALAPCFYQGPYQLVDLYGEGIPGIFYQEGESYYYRAPCRLPTEEAQGHLRDHADSSTYAEAWSVLATRPLGKLSDARRNTLMDITNSGEREWVMTQPGLAGFFTLGRDQQFKQFIPFDLFPSEFQHPEAQLADIMGAGLSDLVLVGSKGVRVYPNQRQKGFSAALTVPYAADDQELPIFNASAKESVVFSDVLGSGQAHLLRIRHNSITCWPNLGRGRFGRSIAWASLPFDELHFDPKRLFLADLDGSGASDVVYAERDHLKIFCNQSGNGLAAPEVLPLPDGVYYDNLHQLSVADIHGDGYSCLLLSALYPEPRHWIYDCNAREKPYLLHRFSNNLGLGVEIHYRNSAQEWLDEKRENAAASSGLSFSMPLVKRLVQHDEITGNRLVTIKSYRQGYYDKVEREFNGFGLVISHDTEMVSADSNEKSADICAALCTKTWYHTGISLGKAQANDYYTGDERAQHLGETLCTDSGDQPLRLSSEQAQEQHRVLRGLMRRQEIYSTDNRDEQAKHPYHVSESRYLTRLLQIQQPYSCWFTSVLEQLEYNYERVPDDPRCSQQIDLSWDRYGAVTRRVAIQYPRRVLTPQRYPAEYYDPQQNYLHLHEEEARWIHLDHPNGVWRLHLPCEQSSWEASLPMLSLAQIVRAQGAIFSYEDLQQPAQRDQVTALAQERQLSSKVRYYYSSPSQDHVEHRENCLPLGSATVQALLSHTCQVEISPQQLEAMQVGYSGDRALLKERLHAGKYDFLENYYWITSPKAVYNGAERFYRLRQHADAWNSQRYYDYDQYAYVLTQVQDDIGVTRAVYDYQHLQVVQLTDYNDNVTAVAYDALGRIVATTRYGMMYVLEGKKLSTTAMKVGFREECAAYVAHTTLAQALDNAMTAIQDWATVHYYAPYSWMGEFPSAVIKKNKNTIARLKQHHYLTEDNQICASLRWLTEAQLQQLLGTSLTIDRVGIARDLMTTLEDDTLRIPVHSASFVSDHYPSDPKRQVRINLVYNDGFGRLLADYQRGEPGPAYQSDGNRQVTKGVDGHPIMVDTLTRWRVSEKKEYNNKGLVVRSYLPYFIDTHQYIRPLHDTPYFTLYYYDAMGREIKVVNAEGYFRRVAYFTWHHIQEDENDTWYEMLRDQQHHPSQLIS